MMDGTYLAPPMPPHLDTPEKRREFIIGFEDALAAQPNAVWGDNEIMPLTHKFCDGMYIREIFIPAGMLLTGKIYLRENPCFLMMGTIAIITEEGGLVMMSAPQVVISPAGCKRAAYALTDVKWANVYLNPNGHTSFSEEYERELVRNTYEEIEQ